MLLLDLPVSLTKVLLSEWVELKGLTKLDSACCHWITRGAYLTILRAEPPLAPFIAELKEQYRMGFMHWILARGLTVRKFEFRDGKSEELDVCTSFLGVVGEHLETLHASSPTAESPLMDVASAICTQLKHFVLQANFRDSASVRFDPLLVRCAQTLEGVKLYLNPEQSSLKAFALPKLRHLHIIAPGGIAVAALSESIRQCPLLVSFHCAGLGSDDTCLDALAAHCPRLKVLGFGSFGTSSEALRRLLQARPLLEVVEAMPLYHGVESVSGAQLETIAQYGANIRALQFTLSDDTSVGDASLAAIAQMPRLTHLRINELPHLSDTVVQAWTSNARFCATLMELELPELGMGVSEAALTSLLSGLSQLRKLNLAYCDCVTDNLLRVVSQNVHLEVLAIVECSGFTEACIIPLSEGCPALRKLCVSYREPGEGVFSPLVQHLWRLHRPHLRFCTGHLNEHPSFWDRIADVTRLEDVPL
jgi:hypothetical protein